MEVRMRAIMYTQYGPPEVLHLKVVEKPTLKYNDVLIKVIATTVNRTDCAMLRAKPFIMRFFTGPLRPKNPILGTTFAGTIESVGMNVTSFKTGDQVFGFDDRGLSSYAEYLILRDDRPFTVMPKNVSHAASAAAIEGAHYAINFINKVLIGPGKKVLVNGASGAIGSAAVQLLKFYGADVDAVCSTKNISLVRSLGAEKIFDYTKEDFTTTGQRYDFIFDTVGKSSFGDCKPLLNPNGIYSSSELGTMGQNVFFALMAPIMSDKKVIFPIPANIKASLRLVKDLMEQNKFRAVIDRTYPLDQIAAAFRYVETGEKTGNVVVSLEEKP